jgi:alpha-N-arabinofuranosidase
LLARLQGSRAPQRATVRLHTITAGLTDRASLEQPDAIRPVSRTIEYAKDLAVELEPYTVAVVEIRAA